MKGNRWLRVAFVVSAAIAVHALGGSAQATPVQAGPKTLAGFTAEHYPAFFRVSSNGRTLLTGGIAISMTCTSGSNLVVPDAFAHVPIRATGRLHATYTSPTIVQNGVTFSGTDSLTAMLSPNRSRLVGTWRLAVNYTNASGTTDQCDSGPVRFAATG